MRTLNEVNSRRYRRVNYNYNNSIQGNRLGRYQGSFSIRIQGKIRSGTKHSKNST